MSAEKNLGQQFGKVIRFPLERRGGAQPSNYKQYLTSECDECDAMKGEACHPACPNRKFRN